MGGGWLFLGVLLGGDEKQTHTDGEQTTKKWEADYTREVDGGTVGKDNQKKRSAQRVLLTP